MINLIGQTHTIVSKPLCPTLIHDPNLRIGVIIVGLILTSAALYRIMVFYGK